MFARLFEVSMQTSAPPFDIHLLLLGVDHFKSEYVMSFHSILAIFLQNFISIGVAV